MESYCFPRGWDFQQGCGCSNQGSPGYSCGLHGPDCLCFSVHSRVGGSKGLWWGPEI